MHLPPSATPRAAYPGEHLPDGVRTGVHALLARGPVSAYLYDPDLATHAAARLRAALPPWAEVFYAVKANSFPPVLRALATGGVHGYEVASVREAEVAVATARALGVRPRLIASGPGKSDVFLASLVDHDVEAINVESRTELHRLAHVAAAAGRHVPVALRVNPSRVPVGGSLQMGGSPTQFGIPEADVPAALEVARSLPHLDVVGFHVHAVCQNLDAAAHATYVRWCVDWSLRTAVEHGVDLRTVDVGGGVGVAFDGEAPFDLARFGDELDRLRLPGDLRVVLEPGRWLVTDCGWYAAQVIDLKQAYGSWFAVLRGGINHFQLPTSWDVIHRFAVVPVDHWPYACHRPQVRDESVTVVGELCTTEDTLARDVRVPSLRVGDVVVFPMAGSYGWEFAMHEFLGHPPAERWLLPDLCRLALRPTSA